MAPPRKHDTDAILDATRGLALQSGPRSVSIAAIAEASGAPVGTLYHRFGTRDGILTAAWLRALARFQEPTIAADAAHPDDPVEAGVAMAASAVHFSQAHPEDARLLLTVRRDDLLDHTPDDALRQRLDVMNAPLEDALRRIARGLHGRADARALDAVTRAVVDLPTAALRRHLRDGGAARVPGWLAADVADAARALLHEIVPA
jgi:AcrR family transcriptional regulator